jgi:hypothetical protein
MGTKFNPCKVTVVPTEYALATFGRNRETAGAAEAKRMKLAAKEAF